MKNLVITFLLCFAIVASIAAPIVESPPSSYHEYELLEKDGVVVEVNSIVLTINDCRNQYNYYTINYTTNDQVEEEVLKKQFEFVGELINTNILTRRYPVKVNFIKLQDSNYTSIVGHLKEPSYKQDKQIFLSINQGYWYLMYRDRMYNYQMYT